MSRQNRSLLLMRAMLLALFAGFSVLFVVTVMLLRGSLATLTGEVALPDLEATVSVARDVRGRPVLTAGSWSDLAMALGYLHGQERFFQMDMARRAAAGELSEVLGAGPLALDRARRMHRLRSVARERLQSLSLPERELISAYARGVNAGLAALTVRPFEYWLLGTRPVDWRDEDLLLVVYAMFFQLTDETAERDAMLTVLQDVYPSAYFEFLSQDGTNWDAPLMGAARPSLPVPTATDYTLPATQPDLARRRPHQAENIDRPLPGSNNWALHGSRTASGAALLANDMHLGLQLPNIWYPARLRINGPVAGEYVIDVTGVTLPGTFGVIVGSNGEVAWGFTNSYGDWSDRVLLEIDPQDPARYRVGDHFEAFVEYQETIAVKGAEDVAASYRWTRWGPVVGTDHLGRPHALKWLAHEPEAVNSRIIELASAANVPEALALANQVGAPPQNFVAADRRGNIGWTILGRLPVKRGFDPRVAASWADPDVGWQGWLAADDYPRIINPPGGQIWTANARVVDGEWLSLIGDSGYALGARSRQIRDGLRQLEAATARDMLELQLDDRALFLQRWQAQLLGLLDEAALAGHPQRAELRGLVRDWSGRATVDDAGFRLVRAWRAFLLEEVFLALTQEAQRADPNRDFYSRQWEGALWALLEAQPVHLLPPQYTSWRDWMLHSVDITIEYFTTNYPGALSQRVWGERNRVRVGHPLSRFVPALGALLDMPTLSLPGDSNMPRVQSPGEGASQRLAVSPGHESSAYFHMPGGQSGHPLSPFYDTDHTAWARGEPQPLLPGTPVYLLNLVPGVP